MCTGLLPPGANPIAVKILIIIIIIICGPSSGCIAVPKVKSQPEDGPHIGPKHVVVVLVYC